jgi:hypothetical protein
LHLPEGLAATRISVNASEASFLVVTVIAIHRITNRNDVIFNPKSERRIMVTKAKPKNAQKKPRATAAVAMAAVAVDSDFQKVSDVDLNSPTSAWKRLIRLDPTSSDIARIGELVEPVNPEKLIFAEGDSWFDKFTPVPFVEANLLSHICVPFHAAVLDCALVGDVSGNMVRGSQRWRTETIFDFYSFDAILLSAGGNNLKDVVADTLSTYVKNGKTPAGKQALQRASSYKPVIDEVVEDIRKFVELRDASSKERTRNAPILFHGYDYLQPRPAAAQLIAGFSGFERGPWLHPMLAAAGFTDAEMRSLADAIVDEINIQFAALAATLPNVLFIDQRGLLAPAVPASTGESGHWLDEIHPSIAGFKHLARNRWDVTLAKALGWKGSPANLTAADATQNLSTASA